MALHGVTMPLQLVGHEATLALAYSRDMGMSDERDPCRSSAAPATCRGVYMGCLDSFAGPLPARLDPAASRPRPADPRPRSDRSA